MRTFKITYLVLFIATPSQSCQKMCIRTIKLKYLVNDIDYVYTYILNSNKTYTQAEIHYNFNIHTNYNVLNDLTYIFTCNM